MLTWMLGAKGTLPRKPSLHSGVHTDVHVFLMKSKVSG